MYSLSLTINNSDKMNTEKQFLIAYHTSNREKALAMQKALAPSGCSFELFSNEDAGAPGEFNRKLASKNKHALLLVSDNLLKDEGCMLGGLEAVQQLSGVNKILPIVIDGEYPGQENVTTVFERVGDVIQYLNHWQDAYIQLRQRRRHPEEGEDLERINEAIAVVRQVSSEIGEYLRHLRVVKHYSWEQLQANDWELFFRLIQFHEGHSRLKSALAGVPVEEEAPEIVVAEPQETAEEAPEPPAEEPQMPELEPVVFEENPVVVEFELEEEHEHEETPADSNGAEAPEMQENIPADVQQRVEDLFDEAVSEEEERTEEAAPGDTPLVEEPAEAGAILEEARRKFEQSDLAGGLNLLSQAVEDFPQSAFLRYHYAQALVEYAQNGPEAALELEKLVRLAPEYIQAWYLLGDLSERSGRFKQARQYFEHAVYLDDGYSEAYFRLGLLLLQRFEGEEKQAARYFRKAYKEDKKFAEALYQYGVIMNERLGKSEKAIKAFRRTLEIQPDHLFANYDLALIYYEMGEKKKAHQYYLQAVANNPELQTPENDQAFFIEPAPVSDQPEEHPAPVSEPQAALETEKPTESEGVALITGATSGIGKATARAFAQAGYNLIVTGRREERLEELRQSLEDDYHVRVKTLCFDVRDAEATESHLHSLDETWRQVDVLVNNAGLAKGLSTVQDGELAHWETMIDTNIKGLLYVTRAVTPWMVARKKGLVINIGSIAGKEAYPKGNVYCATKFAVDGLTKAMRLDLYQHGIRVSQICPGHVEETEFALVRFDGDAERAKIYGDFKPLSSADVAEIALYIAQAPPHVNIQDVVVTSSQQAGANHIDRSGR